MGPGLNNHAGGSQFPKLLAHPIRRGANPIFFRYRAAGVQDAVATPAVAKIDSNGVTRVTLVSTMRNRQVRVRLDSWILLNCKAILFGQGLGRVKRKNAPSGGFEFAVDKALAGEPISEFAGEAAGI